MDVVISKDGQVVIAHEPFMPSNICARPDGTSIAPEEQHDLNLYQMDYEEIKAFNCGLRHPDFEEQVPQPVHRPLLSELFTSIEAYCQELKLSPKDYTIELKSKDIYDNIYHPEPHEFVSKVLAEINEKDLASRCVLQSFDLRILQELQKQSPGIRMSLLLDQAFELDKALDELGFVPSHLGPKFTLVDRPLVEACHERGMLLVPWTVNEVSDMEKLIALGVDGLITDYPDRKAQIVE